VFSTFREVSWGCEHFGPQILTGEFVTEPLRFANFHVHLPTGSGIGMTLDTEKLRHYART
jgi:muconate cycloisomerase